MSERALPFYCGSQRMDWKCFNCEYCTKRYTEQAKWRCDLEKLIDEGYMGDGSVSAETAKRMGMPEDVRIHNWRCPEFIEDKAERDRVARLQAERQAAKTAYDNRHRPAPWIEEWLAKRKAT